MSADKRSRFGFVTNPRIQFKYAFLNSLFVAGVILLTNLVVVYRLRSFTFQSEVEMDNLLLNNIIEFTVQLGIISFLMAFVVTFFSSLIITHRFVGPFVSINRYVDALINNKFDEPLNLRTSDEMHEISGKLKILGQKLKDKS
ncbi:MAG: hypothetical protein HUU56_07995 [Bdellovibrionaceae bacterium]|nr:hypothetical protein [Pseudobdellovibrionaceae bacterium]